MHVERYFPKVSTLAFNLLLPRFQMKAQRPRMLSTEKSSTRFPRLPRKPPVGGFTRRLRGASLIEAVTRAMTFVFSSKKPCDCRIVCRATNRSGCSPICPGRTSRTIPTVEFSARSSAGRSQRYARLRNVDPSRGKVVLVFAD